MQNKYTLFIFGLLTFFIVLPINTFSQCNGIVNIPDTNFKAALVDYTPTIDTNGDKEIQCSEAEAFNGELDLSFKAITNLEGFEAFVNTTQLDIKHNYLTSLDVSENALLTALYCDHNDLTTINITQNSLLEILSFNFNEVASIDLSQNTKLTSLNCLSNNLISLDVSNNKDLITLHCESNNLTTLNVTQNTALSSLKIDGNEILDIDVTQNITLLSFECNNNLISNIDISKNTQLTTLKCSNNNLNSLDVSKNIALTQLTCNNDSLKTLDLSNNTSLTYLYCSDNQLTALDISNNTSLKHLGCHRNQITDLDLSNNVALTFLYAHQNQLTKLNLANGNNPQMTPTVLSNNSNLTCIQVDDETDATTHANWTKDTIASYSNNCSVGLSEFAKNSFNIFPNPSYEQFYIYSNGPSNGQKMIITNSLGQTVYTTILYQQKQLVSAKNFPKGVYFINIENGLNTITEKLLIQ